MLQKSTHVNFCARAVDHYHDYIVNVRDDSLPVAPGRRKHTAPIGFSSTSATRAVYIRAGLQYEPATAGLLHEPVIYKPSQWV